MELRQIRYFLALCDEPNFGRAAKRCGIAQPSLTKAIQRLEKDIGGPLLLRRPKVQPTPLGLALKPHFERVLTGVLIAQQEAALGFGRQGMIGGGRCRTLQVDRKKYPKNGSTPGDALPSKGQRRG